MADREVVRQPVSVRAARSRHWSERLALRFPRALVLVGRVVLSLPPRSRLRRAFLRQAIELAVSAANRRDFDAAFAFFHPDAEATGAAGITGLGAFPEVVRGRSARKELEARWRADWGEFRYEPTELLDLSDRVLMLGRMVGAGAASGAPFDTEWGDLLTLSGGQVIREQVFFNRAEALSAVGLSD